MLDVYAAEIESQIQSSVVVSTYSLQKVNLSPNTGYIEGEIAFFDASRFIFFIFLRQTAANLMKDKYRYHFMNADNKLIFRYDNAPHHPTVDTFPHHKHLSDRVVASNAPDFSQIFVEIETHILGIP